MIDRSKENNNNSQSRWNYRIERSKVGSALEERIYLMSPEDYRRLDSYIRRRLEALYLKSHQEADEPSWSKYVFLQDLLGKTKIVGVNEDFQEEIKREDEELSLVVWGEYAYPWLELLSLMKRYSSSGEFSNKIVDEMKTFFKDRKRKLRIVVPRKEEYVPSFLLRVPREYAINEGFIKKDEAEKVLGPIRPMKESSLFTQVYSLFSQNILDCYKSEIAKRNLKKECSPDDIRALEFLISEEGIRVNLYLEPKAFESNDKADIRNITNI